MCFRNGGWINIYIANGAKERVTRQVMQHTGVGLNISLRRATWMAWMGSRAQTVEEDCGAAPAEVLPQGAAVRRRCCQSAVFSKIEVPHNNKVRNMSS